MLFAISFLFVIGLAESFFGMLIAVLMAAGLAFRWRALLAFVVGIWLVVVGPVGVLGSFSLALGICMSVPFSTGKLKIS